MDLANLGLWADEEKRIHECLRFALNELIQQGITEATNTELEVSGQLRPLILRYRKEMKLNWTFQAEASVFDEETNPKPSGHPDIRFSFVATDGEQWDYDIECKLVRIKRSGRTRDYCEQYVSEGIERFASGRYCAQVSSGAMIGYIQEGDQPKLLTAVNKFIRARKHLSSIRRQNTWQTQGITQLTNSFSRTKFAKFRLTHLWADLRKKP